MREELVQLGERIRTHRRRKKWTQTELAHKIGYSMNGIAKIERGESDPKFSALTKIAGVLEIELRDLVSGSDLTVFSARFPDNATMAAFYQQWEEFMAWRTQQESGG